MKLDSEVRIHLPQLNRYQYDDPETTAGLICFGHVGFSGACWESNPQIASQVWKLLHHRASLNSLIHVTVKSLGVTCADPRLIRSHSFTCYPHVACSVRATSDSWCDCWMTIFLGRSSSAVTWQVAGRATCYRVTLFGSTRGACKWVCVCEQINDHLFIDTYKFLSLLDHANLTHHVLFPTYRHSTHSWSFHNVC